MRLTLHIVVKDLIRLRWWIVCWVAVLLLPVAIGVGFVARSPFDQPTEWKLPGTYALLVLLEVLVGYVLTLVLMQEDAIVGTQQFWLSRPISRGRLLAAKTIGAIILLGLTPSLVSLPWWLWCGFGGREIARAALEMLVLGLQIAIPAALVAVLTDSLARALLWSLVLAALVPSLGLFFSFVNAAGLGGRRDPIVFVLRPLIAVVVITAEMALMVALQFLLRRRGWWLGLAGGAVAVSLFAISTMQWTAFALGPRERHPERATSVTVAFDRAVAHAPYTPKPTERGYITKHQRLATQFTIDGIPDGFAWGAFSAEQSWEWPGVRLERATPLWRGRDARAFFGLSYPAVDPETNAWWAQQPKPQKTVRPAGGVPLRRNQAEAAELLPPSLVQRMQREPPVYQARVWMGLAAPEIECEVPLRAGSFHARNGHGIRVERLEKPTGTNPRDVQPWAVILTSSPGTILGALWSATLSPSWFPTRVSDASNFIINRERKEIVGLSHGEYRELVINGVRLVWRKSQLVGLEVVRQGQWVIRPGWLDKASLAAVQFPEHAVFKRDIRVEKLEVQPRRQVTGER
ncbi:MAG: hypothetical protein Q7S40_33370 [Opitutaceae bacterium]|nr:hypothetical protein [Opitutaceae bacterium]